MSNYSESVPGFRKLITGTVLLPGEEGSDRVREAYTEEVWDQLVKAKKRWDPENVFQMNQNIPPG